MLRISGASGSELLQAATKQVTTKHTAAGMIARCRRRSILITLTVTAESAGRCGHDAAVCVVWFHSGQEGTKMET
nr:hypothetical protein MFLOJ_37180 [Mycobacterium florentinum]